MMRHSEPSLALPQSGSVICRLPANPCQHPRTHEHSNLPLDDRAVCGGRFLPDAQCCSAFGGQAVSGCHICSPRAGCQKYVFSQTPVSSQYSRTVSPLRARSCTSWAQCDRRYSAAIDLVFVQSSPIRHEKPLMDFHGLLET